MRLAWAADIHDWTVLVFVLATAPPAQAFCALFLPMAQGLRGGLEAAADLQGHEPWVKLRE